MSYPKTILCLANSRKPPSGRCVAGREVVQGGFGDWIRPVSARETREISEEERRYENGTHPKVLDVIEIQLSEAVPHDHQQENHQIDDQCYWVKRRSIGWQELLDAVEQVNGPLWTNNSSSYYGRHDRVPAAELGGLEQLSFLCSGVSAV